MTGGRTAPRLAMIVVTALVCGMALEGTSHAQTADDAAALHAEAERLYQAGKYPEATEIAQRLLAIREKSLGPDHPLVGIPLYLLAELYLRQGRYAEAEPLFKRALRSEKALGPDHPTVGHPLNNLAVLYQQPGPLRRGRAALQAQPRHQREGARARPPRRGHSRSTTWPMLYTDQGRYAEAEPLYKRSLAISEKALGPDHPDVGTSLNNLAVLYQAQGRYAEAEPLYKRSLAIREKALGPDHPDVGTSLNNLAVLYQAQGRYAEAEPLYKRSLASARRRWGPTTPTSAPSLNNLAVLYQARAATPRPSRSTSAASRSREGAGARPPRRRHRRSTTWPAVPGAGPLRRGRAASQAQPRDPREGAGARPPRRRHVAQQPGRLYQSQGRYAEAEPLYKRSLAIREKALGPDHPDVGTALNNLAGCTETRAATPRPSRFTSAASPSARRRWGPTTPTSACRSTTWPSCIRSQGRYAEAEPLYKRSLAISEKALGPDHPDVGTLAQQPGRAVPGPGPLRRGRAALQAQPGDPREGAGARASRCGRVAQQPGQAVSEPGPLRRGRAACTSAAWRSARRRWGPSTPTSARRSTTWPCCTSARAATPRPSRSTSAASPSARRRWGPTTPMSASRSTTWPRSPSSRRDWARAADYLAAQHRHHPAPRRARPRRRPRGEHRRGGAATAHGISGRLSRRPIGSRRRAAAPSRRSAAEMFETAQWAQGSEAAASLAQMAARSAKGSPQLAGLVRERQDLVSEWQAKDKLLIAAKSEPAGKAQG